MPGCPNTAVLCTYDDLNSYKFHLYKIYRDSFVKPSADTPMQFCGLHVARKLPQTLPELTLSFVFSASKFSPKEEFFWNPIIGRTLQSIIQLAQQLKQVNFSITGYWKLPLTTSTPFRCWKSTKLPAIPPPPLRPKHLKTYRELRIPS